MKPLAQEAPSSPVLAHPLEPSAAAAELRARLALATDPSDLQADLAAGVPGLTVVDARSREAYARGHIPGALNLPHREMSPLTTARLDRAALHVVYCDGIGCNGSTKGALRLAELGFAVKELIGGLEWWVKDGYPVATGSQPGPARPGPAQACGC